jgi:hypothetical protein
VNYVRAVLPARHLPGATAEYTDISLKNRFKYLQPDENGDKRVAFLDQRGDTAIWMFPGNWIPTVLMREQQLNGIRVLVEVDDNYRTGPPDENLSEWTDTLEQAREQGKKATYEAHEKIVGNNGDPWIDGLIVSTPQLAKEYEDLHPNIYVCPNCVDPDDWNPEPSHQPIVGEAIGSSFAISGKRQRRTLRIGWAASDSHGVDIPLIDGALKWASRQPDVEVVLVGIATYKPSFPHLHIPFAPLPQYRKNLENIDVMLCPLYSSRWADCKSDVKAMEGAMAGAMPIVSAVPPYEPWFGQPGALVAEDQHEFVKHVQWCVKNRDHVRGMAHAARQYVLKDRTIQGNVWRWREACGIPVDDEPLIAA